MIATSPALICYPPAPLNGGPLTSLTPPKVGEWVWQPKIDDWRAVIHTPTGTIWNQYGQLSSFTDTDKFTSALGWLRVLQSEEAQYEWLDVGMMQNRNDMMRGSVVVLDLIVPNQPFHMRRKRLESMFQHMPLATITVGRPDLANDRVYLVPQVTGEKAGRTLYTDLQLQNVALGRKFYEGVVAKEVTSHYLFGQRPKQQWPNWIKHRFDQ
jgi:hypothetical protein